MGSFFIRRPIVAMVISIVMVIMGAVAITRLPVAQFPDITPPLIQVTTTYTGASALDVESSVATPIEQQVNGVDNMIYMKSTNANDGTYNLQVSFEVGTDLDMSNVLVQNRVSQATACLPQDVKNYGVTVKKSLNFPLMLVTLTSPSGAFDNNFLSNYAAININDQLKRITGVGDVVLFGGSDYAMRIWVRPDRLKTLGLTVADLSNAVKQQNVLLPAGQIGGPPAPKGTEFTYVGTHQGAPPRRRGVRRRSWCARTRTARRCASRTWPGSTWAPCSTTRWAASTGSPPPSSPSTRRPARTRSPSPRP